MGLIDDLQALARERREYSCKPVGIRCIMFRTREEIFPWVNRYVELFGGAKVEINLDSVRFFGIPVEICPTMEGDSPQFEKWTHHAPSEWPTSAPAP